MSEQVDPIDIATNAQTLDWLRSELVGSAAQSLRAMSRGDEEATVAALASNVALVYLLARRMGVSFTTLDNQLIGQLRNNVHDQHELERRYGDLSALLEYLQPTRGLAAWHDR